MYAAPLRYCNVIKQNPSVFAFKNKHTNLGPIASVMSCRSYSKCKDNKDCCIPPDQTAGKKVVDWPTTKTDPPPIPWRPECSAHPQPPNYDPYKIKVPDIVVPPLPPSNAKELPNEGAEGNRMQMPFGACGICPDGMQMPYGAGGICQDLFNNSPIIHPDYWQNKPEKRLQELVKETVPKLGYHGRTKYKYAFHEPWNPLDRVTLMEQAEKDENPDSEHSKAATDTHQLQ